MAVSVVALECATTQLAGQGSPLISRQSTSASQRRTVVAGRAKRVEYVLKQVILVTTSDGFVFVAVWGDLECFQVFSSI